MIFFLPSKISDLGCIKFSKSVCDIIDGIPNSHLEQKVEILEREKSDLVKKVKGKNIFDEYYNFFNDFLNICNLIF